MAITQPVKKLFNKTSKLLKRIFVAVKKYLKIGLKPLLELTRPLLKPLKKLSNRMARIVKRYTPSFVKTKQFGFATLAVLIFAVAFVGRIIYQNKTYQITKDQKTFISRSTIDAKYIKESAKDISYDRSDETSPKDPKQQITVDSPLDATGKSLYSAKLSKNPKDGVTFSDEKGDRKFSISSTASLSGGRLEEGSVVYPASTTEKHIYSFKKNGLKEDILLTKSTKKVLTFSWQLKTGNDLEARMLPDGSVGMYSANPYLFGDLTVSDDKSQKLIDNARQNGKKDYLVFVMPKPYIIDSRGIKNYDDVSFSLKDNMLTVEARNMLTKHYPLSIDPTIVVTTTSDFLQGIGNTSNTDYSTAGQINRNNISSGELGTWLTDAGGNFTTTRFGHSAVAYNGFLYVIGGCSVGGCTTFLNDVQYAPINSGGDVGAWTATASFITARYRQTAVVYNGFLYVIGGCSAGSCTTFLNDVQFAPISGTGTLGAWHYTDGNTDRGVTFNAGFTTGRFGHTSVAYNGFLYVIGGCSAGSCTTFLNDTQYAPMNADGTVGAWTTDTGGNFTTTRYSHTSVAYNGFLYVLGGCSVASCTTFLSDVQEAPINADGSIGAWVATTSFTTARHSHTSVAYGGYLYVIGGCSAGAGCTTFQSTTQYAPINANGTVGTWSTGGTSLTTARYGHATVAYNNFIYVIGGCTVAACTTFQNDVQYAPLVIGGSGARTTNTNYFFLPRNGHSAVAYNGYMYIIAGQITTASTSCKDPGSGPPSVVECSSVEYAPINANGSVGAFTTSANYIQFPRLGQYAMAYNGYLYVVGGRQIIANTNTNCKDASLAVSNNRCSDIQYAAINPATGDIGAFTTNSKYFQFPRYFHYGSVWNSYLYIYGGEEGAASTGGCKDTGISDSECNDTQYAKINSDGSVGTFYTSSYFLTPRRAITGVAYNGYLYIGGGVYNFLSTECKNTGTSIQWCNDVQYAKINSNGSLGPFANTSYFAVPRRGQMMVVWNGYLYVLAGQHGTSDTLCNSVANVDCSDIQYAKINLDGSLAAFAVNPNVINIPRTQGAAVAYNNYLYVMGGNQTLSNNNCNNSAAPNSDPAQANCDDVQYFNVGPVNSAGTWGSTSSFITARSGHSTVAYNGYLYLTGGNGFQNDVQYVPVSNDGTLGAWHYTHSSIDDGVTFVAGFTTGRSGHTSVAYNGYLYILGGNNGTTDLNDVQYAPINANGTIGVWASTNNFNTIRTTHTSVAYNGYMYVIGGYDSAGFALKSDVQYAPINADGTVGAWTITSSFATARSHHSSVVYNGFLYVIGGCSSGTCTTFLNDVQYTAINNDGSLGNWNTTTSFTTARDAHSSVVYNGNLYVIGGFNIADMNDVQYATIKTDGTVGEWTATTTFTTARDSHSSVAYNGYVYVIGGFGGGNLNNVQFTPLITTSFKARYERFFDTSSAGNIINSFVINGIAKCSYNVTYKTAGSSGVFGAATTLINVFPGVSQTITAASQRYVSFVVTMDDSACGGQSTITDMQLTYNAAPDAPTLIQPANNTINVNILPEFRLGTTDDSNDYLKYKIDVCSISDCSVIVRTIDQTASQTGWLSQSQQSATAYSGGAVITQLAIHQYQAAALSGSTQYWWRAYAIDPGGSNQLSTASAISTFTTGATLQSNINVNGSTSIYGGSTLKH